MSSFICSFLLILLLYSVFNEHFLYQASQRVIALLLAELSALLGSRHCRVVGSSGLEPPTSRLSGARSNHLSYEPIKLFGVSRLSRLVFASPYVFCRPGIGRPGFRTGGDDGIRTHDPLLAGQVLSQLSYTPSLFLRGYFTVTEN